IQAVKHFNTEIQEAYKRGKADGRIDCPRENVLLFPGVEDDLVHFNTTRVIHKSSINGDELSSAEVEGRQQLRQIWKVLGADVPLFRHSRLHSIAAQIGLRESRRVRGRAYLTLADYE